MKDWQSWLMLCLWLFWSSLGTLLAHLEAILDHLKALLEDFWTILSPRTQFNDSFTLLLLSNL